MDAETKLDAGRTTLTTATLNSMITDTHLEGNETVKFTRKSDGGVNVWVLVTMDAKQPIGEMASIFAFSSEAAAKAAMERDIYEMSNERGFGHIDLLFSEDETFAMTKDERYSWSVELLDVEDAV